VSSCQQTAFSTTGVVKQKFSEYHPSPQLDNRRKMVCEMHAMSKPESAIALKQTVTASGLGLSVKCTRDRGASQIEANP
jgi:hypothetical protein